jgi:lipopolysaccharide heptosyltransferase III
VENILDSLPRAGRVAIVRLRSLGDCVLTTPAAEILKRARPDLQVAITVEDRFRAIFEGNPDIDCILGSDPLGLRRWRPELCLNLHGGGRSAWLTAFSGARYRAGFAHFRHQFTYNVHIPRAQEILGAERKVHTVEHLASAIFYLGAPRNEIPRAKLAAEGRSKDRGCAVIHPLAATAEKTWRADGFLAVAEALQKSGIAPVFIGGPGDNLTAFRAYRVIAGEPLAGIKSLLAGAILFIGNDSGPAHMAAAFGLPVVVIFGPSDPVIWGPWRTASQIVSSPAGIGNVSVDQVLDAIARLRVPA